MAGSGSLADTAPHVVIVGGYLTLPVFYRPLAERLLERGVARVSVAPILWSDWLLAALVGFGPVLLRAARAIRAARRSADAPVIVVGHSAGGIVARLAMSPVPLDGRQVGVAEDVGCLVTLGTPHRLHGRLGPWQHPGIRATRFLEGATPGAWFAPTTGYVSVGSTCVPPGRPAGTPAIKRPVDAFFATVVGRSPDTGGDGIVADDLARLEGAEHVTLDDCLHGTFGGPWYGDAAMVDRWWPVALASWREALAARGSRKGAPGRRRPVAEERRVPGRGSRSP